MFQIIIGKHCTGKRTWLNRLLRESVHDKIMVILSPGSSSSSFPLNVHPLYVMVYDEPFACIFLKRKSRIYNPEHWIIVVDKYHRHLSRELKSLISLIIHESRHLNLSVILVCQDLPCPSLRHYADNIHHTCKLTKLNKITYPEMKKFSSGEIYKQYYILLNQAINVNVLKHLIVSFLLPPSFKLKKTTWSNLRDEMLICGMIEL
jgi:hypothetical protein